jgi:6-pyruvoyltetrahydropterin/6-carboxytetrahydropterin synthase
MIITRLLHIDAGHRLIGHSGKCKNYHGHRYVFEVTVGSPELDEGGMVIDFGIVKEKIGGWLDEHWDHGMIVQSGDPFIEFAKGSKMFVLVDPPTAENLSRYLFARATELLSADRLKVRSIRCWETPNCYAECDH